MSTLLLSPSHTCAVARARRNVSMSVTLHSVILSGAEPVSEIGEDGTARRWRGKVRHLTSPLPSIVMLNIPS